MLMDICLPKFDIYQGTVTQVVLRAAKTLEILFSFKKILSDVRSEIHLVRRNIVSTGESVQALKKIIFGLTVGDCFQVVIFLKYWTNFGSFQVIWKTVIFVKTGA